MEAASPVPRTAPRSAATDRTWKRSVEKMSAVSIPSRVIMNTVKANTPRNPASLLRPRRSSMS